MPVQACNDGGKPGYRYGQSGACYTYAAGDEGARRKAKQQAYIQGAAIEASQARRGEKPKTAVIDLLIQKQFDTTLSIPEVIPAEIMEQICRRAGEAVPPDQALVRTAHLCNTQYDRSHERFPVEYLERFAETIPGKSLLPGHDKSQVPMGVWLSGEVVKDGAGISHLRVPFYMDAKSEMARRVRLGIAKQVSIGFKAAGRTCDLCGTAYDGFDGCENGHQKGRTYDGKLCTITYSGDPTRVEAMEGSLVWLGCQYGAEVTGAKEIDPWGGHVLSITKSEETKMPDELIELRAKVAELEDENKTLQALAADGKAYREHLRGEIARKLSSLHPDHPEAAKAEAEMILTTLADANLATLKAWDENAQKKFDAKFPPPVQSRALGEGAVQAPREGTPSPGSAPGRIDPFASLRG